MGHLPSWYSIDGNPFHSPSYPYLNGQSYKLVVDRNIYVYSFQGLYQETIGMKLILNALVAAALACSSAYGAVTVRVEEVGNDVVAIATGAINTAGFDIKSGAIGSIGGRFAGTGFVPSWTCDFGVGSTVGVDAYVANGLVNTDVCSTGGRVNATTNSGSFVGIVADAGRNELVVYVTPGYVSGEAINSTSTWPAQTFASIGLVPGRYLYTWGSGANADSITLLIGQYSVGGSVTGLSGSVVLQVNGGDDLAVSADGVFTFPATLSDNTTYAVTVATQPNGQSCSVANDSGMIAGADVTNVVVECEDIAASSPPAEPETVSATAGNAEATVSWTAPSDNGGSPITGYTVTSAPDGQICATSETSCTVAGLTNGTAYTFTVVASNDVGDSAPSAASNSVTPDADSDGDGTPDRLDAFPFDPVEDTDSDGDGIGDNGDAGGTGIGIKIVSAPVTCEFSGPVENTAAFLDSAPGTPLDRQLRFVLTGCGSSVTIEAFFGAPLPTGSVAYKVSSSGVWTPVPGATIEGNRITYTITDNGPLDDDDIIGQITDPITSLVPFSAPPAPIPTLPAFGLALLTILMGLLGRRHLRRAAN